MSCGSLDSSHMGTTKTWDQAKCVVHVGLEVVGVDVGGIMGQSA